MNNPFTPAFGKEPLFLAGRENIISDVLEGLQGSPGDPNRSTILIGPRGSGKTVLISHLAGLAKQRGWISADVTALPGMMEGIIEQALTSGREVLPAPAKTKLKGLSALGFGVDFDSAPEVTPSWRMRITQILDVLDATGTGLLVTVDEVDAKLTEMVQLVADFQHLIRENRNVALLMAGLPGKVLQMFGHKSISFMRRAFQHRLGSVSQADVRMVLRRTVESSGRTIEKKALDQAAEFTSGFPFLIQMTGYHIWRQSPDNPIIDRQDVTEGMHSAEENMNQMILETTVRELSDGDVRFLRAMVEDTQFSRLADIINRLGVSSSQAGQYRLRLIRQGVIEEFGRGKVQFTMPLLKKYLQKHHAR